ncbi:hypothetical protein E2542_SST19998 [Spatholobus suberectus]|nr:hypothetical protein E2542_SST19998 [Spatholobus suberectus]
MHGDASSFFPAAFLRLLRSPTVVSPESHRHVKPNTAAQNPRYGCRLNREADKAYFAKHCVGTCMIAQVKQWINWCLKHRALELLAICCSKWKKRKNKRQ